MKIPKDIFTGDYLPSLLLLPYDGTKVKFLTNEIV